MNWMRRAAAAERGGERLDQRRLRDARDALEQRVPAREERDEHRVDRAATSPT